MSTRNRTLAIVLTCVTCASAAAAQSPEQPQERVRQQREQSQIQRQPVERRAQRRGGAASAETSEAVTQTAVLVPGATFELRNTTGGDVTITGADGGRMVRIEAVKRVRNVPNPAAALRAIRIVVAERGGNVEVRTVYPGSGGAARATAVNRPVAIVDYTVVLPPNANIVLRTTSGNLRLQNVSGDAFDVNTLSGDVVMQELTGRMLDVHTVSGNMMLQGIAADRAFLQSMAGNLQYAGRLLPTGRYKFYTHGGDIRVIPSGTPGFDLDAMTYRGDLRSEFELRLLQVPPGSARPVRRLKGKVGNAGAALTAQTFSGNIVIIKP